MKDHITIKTKVNFYLDNYPESINPESVVHVQTREVMLSWQMHLLDLNGEMQMLPVVIEQAPFKVEIELEDDQFTSILIDLSELRLKEVEYQEIEKIDNVSFLIRPIEITVDLAESCYYLVMG